MLDKLKKWLFPTAEEFKQNAVDKDKDGLVQEGTPFERKITIVKKPVKKAVAPKKKPVAKKSPAKKTVAKKTTPKKTTKKK